MYGLTSEAIQIERKENPNTFRYSDSNQCSPQVNINEKKKEICMVEASTSTSDKNIQPTTLHGQTANSSFISGLGDKSKESHLNEEHILINVLHTQKTAKSGIENPAFMSRDSDDTNLSKRTALSKNDDDTGESNDANHEQQHEHNNSNNSSIRNSGARCKVKVNAPSRLDSPSSSLSSYRKQSRYRCNENIDEKDRGVVRNKDHIHRSVVGGERLMYGGCDSNDDISRKSENGKDAIDYTIDDAGMLSGSDEWELGNQSSANSSQSSVFATAVRLENVSDWSACGETVSTGSSKSGSKDSASALLGVPPSEYYKRSLKMKDNRVKSTIRRHALRGVRPLLPATMIDECTIEALSKEDLLVMWKSSEIELQKKLGEVMEQKEKLKRLIEKHADHTEL